MELKHILSDEVPCIDRAVKECVNEGRWTLYRSHHGGDGEAVAYYIKGNASLYRLDNAGHVLSIGAIADAPQIDELLYFSDVPSPGSVSDNRGRALESVLT
jgi:hypothetical protein